MRATNSSLKVGGAIAALVTILAVALLGAGCATTQPQGVRSTERTAGQTIDDTTLVTRVKAALVGNPVTKAREIHVEVFRGQVQLAGFVDSAAEKSEAERVAREVSGVKSVRNDLQVQ